MLALFYACHVGFLLRWRKESKEREGYHPLAKGCSLMK
jgi:hypothetical protein